ncbi:MAG: dihydroorotate dehydrogenase [Chloroflexota bacterium]
MAVDLSLSIGGAGKQELMLRNPVMVASGTFSNGIEFAKRFDVDALGAICSKGTTLRPRRGNAQPRTVETASGMINSIGFQNIGVGALIAEIAPIWERWQVPVLVNIMGETIAEYGQLAERLDGVPGVAGLEVNISCPNVEAGGLEFGQDPAQAAAVVSEVRRKTGLPFAVKITPSVSDIRPIARAIEDAGGDAITVMNTIPAMAIDIKRRRPVLATRFGGLSGPAIKPVALRLVYLTASVTKLPILAAGGVSSGTDAIEFFMAGASAVQVGTATFRDPETPWRVIREITDWCEQEGVTRLSDIVGAAQPKD